MLSVVPPTRASCGIEVLAIASFHIGTVVAMPKLPVKKELFVEVALIDETVRSDVVAIKLAPVASEKMREFTGYDV